MARSDIAFDVLHNELFWVSASSSASSRRFTPLVIALTLGFLPFEWTGSWVFEVTFRTGLLIAGVFAVHRARFFVWAGLAGLIGLVQVVSPGRDSFVIQVVALSFAMIFLGYVGYVALREVLSSSRVSPDVLMGGVAVYLLIGHCFGFVFALIHLWNPGCITNVPAESGPLKMEAFEYFSFVTLTTLGYGDMAPVGLVARRLVVAEALLGQMYLTMFIGRLVGFSMAQKADAPPP